MMKLKMAKEYVKKYLPSYIAYDYPVEKALVYFLKSQEGIGKEVTEMSIKQWLRDSFK